MGVQSSAIGICIAHYELLASFAISEHLSVAASLDSVACITMRMMTIRDKSGNILRADVRREQLADSRTPWGVNVWPQGTSEPPAEVRRYYYEKRDQARRGNIDDKVGERGRIA
jgi:hypothetical protein